MKMLSLIVMRNHTSCFNTYTLKIYFILSMVIAKCKNQSLNVNTSVVKMSMLKF